MAKRTEGQLLQLLIPFFKSCFQPQNIGNKITILGFLSYLIRGFKVLCKYYVLFMTYINIIVTAIFQIFHKIILKFVEKKNRASHDLILSLHHKFLCALVQLYSAVV